MGEASSAEPTPEQVLAQLRASFNTRPDFYEQYRPGYSASTFDTLIEKSGIDQGGPVLEIGSGTGIASLPMASRGYEMTCIEPGSGLLGIAKEKLRDYPNVSYVSGSFEDAQLPSNHFKLIYSAMALHWVKPEEQYARTFSLLMPGGSLGVIYTEPVILDDPTKDVFLLALTPLLQHYGIVQDSEMAGRRASDISWAPQPPYTQEASELFNFSHGSIQKQIMNFDSVAFAGYLHTLSKVNNLPEDQRNTLLHRVMELIRNDFDNNVNVPFAETLFVLQKP